MKKKLIPWYLYQFIDSFEKLQEIFEVLYLSLTCLHVPFSFVTTVGTFLVSGEEAAWDNILNTRTHSGALYLISNFSLYQIVLTLYHETSLMKVLMQEYILGFPQYTSIERTELIFLLSSFFQYDSNMKKDCNCISLRYLFSKRQAFNDAFEILIIYWYLSLPKSSHKFLNMFISVAQYFHLPALLCICI